MEFFGPSFAARSNSTTGTLTLTRCAAICAPITPAPSTATLRTGNRFMSSLHTDPGLIAEERADVAAHLEGLAAVQRLQTQLVGLAVVRVGDIAAGPDGRVVVRELGVADDHHADDRFVLAVVAALVAHVVGFRS